MTNDEHYEDIKSRGYNLLRRENPFGSCDVYMHTIAGDILFVDAVGIERDSKTMYDHLIDVWIPQSMDEVDFHLNRMRQWFGLD